MFTILKRVAKNKKLIINKLKHFFIDNSQELHLLTSKITTIARTL